MAEGEDELALGIDLGGTKIVTSVVDAGGRMLSRHHGVTPATRGREAVIEAVIESTRRSLQEANISPSKLTAVGVGAPGLSNPLTGVLYTSPNLPGWQDVPLRDVIARELGRTAYLINDANAAAIGELYYGAGRGTRNFIYVTVSTGIGGGIIINGELYTGPTGTAGEVGHMVIDDNGPLCNCGNRGCWETLASGKALAAEAKRLIKKGTTTTILELAGGTIDEVNAEAVHRAALAGDKLAGRLIARNAYYLGVGLANLINIFNPELIVIGGGLANIGDRLLLPAYQEAGRRAFKQPYQAVRFARAELGQNSGVIGAAAYALEQSRRKT
jgi:glucokinase